MDERDALWHIAQVVSRQLAIGTEGQQFILPQTK
jgi:hypothetical protein